MKYLLLYLIVLQIGCHKPINNMEVSSLRWSEDDLKEISKKMTHAILNASEINYNKNKVYFFSQIKNDSHDHINTQALVSSIRTLLLQSKRFNIVQNTTQHYDYLFKGKISTIFKETQRVKDTYFNINLTLTNTSTYSIIWSHDIEIRKTYKRPLVSW